MTALYTNPSYLGYMCAIKVVPSVKLANSLNPDWAVPAV